MALAGLGLAGLGLATANASPVGNGPLPEPFGPRWSADGSGGATVSDPFEPPDPCLIAACHGVAGEVQPKLVTGHPTGKR